MVTGGEWGFILLLDLFVALGFWDLFMEFVVVYELGFEELATSLE